MTIYKSCAHITHIRDITHISIIKSFLQHKKKTLFFFVQKCRNDISDNKAAK